MGSCYATKLDPEVLEKTCGIQKTASSKTKSDRPETHWECEMHG